MTDADAFLAARDLLLAHRTDIDAARAAFRWPELDAFQLRAGSFRPHGGRQRRAALRFIGPGDHDSSVSFAALSDRSNQVANHLRRWACGAATACCCCWATCRRCGRRCWPAASSAPW